MCQLSSSSRHRITGHHGDHYEWIAGYLEARGYAKVTRLLMAVVSASLVFTAVGAVYGTWMHRELGYALGALATLASVAFTTMWLRGWPSRRQSPRCSCRRRRRDVRQSAAAATTSGTAS